MTTLLRGLCVLLAAVMLTATVGVASAEARWLRAESERFVVYSEGSPAQLTAFVQKLETFDRLLRQRMGLDVDEAPLRKLPVYLVDGRGGINQTWLGAGTSGVAGFYSSDAEGIFAVAIAGGSADDVLLHEYAHHFMMQYFPYGYPAWFVEGFAEYFATTDIRPDRIVVGNYERNNGAVLRGSSWLSMRDLLGKRYGQARDHGHTFYPLAWLLTHWFMAAPERQGQLNAYLLEVGAGGDPVEAMPRATGMSNAALRSRLRRYMSSLPYYEIANDFPPAAVAVTEMPAWADDLLLLSLRLKQGVPDNRRAGVAAEARRAAARHPDEPFAQVVLGHGEIHFGDRAAGEAVLRRLVERHPDNLDGHLFLATSLLERAKEEGADTIALKAEAQAVLARAYAIDDADYRVYILMSRVREGVPGYPTENDIAIREIALTLAPQLAEARLNLASAYQAAGRSADAIATARPLANAPHGGTFAEKAASLINQAQGLTDEEAAARDAAADSAAGEEEEEGVEG